MRLSLQASVIIPTYRRPDNLSVCLDGLASLRTEPKKFEIIIVDNNSSDNTQSVSMSFTHSHPMLHVRYILETRQGLCCARNRGVIEANGEILCFLDDDAAPFPEWLNAMISIFGDPVVGCVGGPALLDYQCQKRPYWLKGDLQGLSGGYQLRYSKTTTVSKVAEFPFGCNIAFRRRVFNELGLFRTDLDRSGNQVLAAGDTEMAIRVQKAGWQIRYVPSARVRHFVSAERLEKEYLYSIGKGLAASHVILTWDLRPHVIARWFASDLWYATRMLFGLVVAIVWRKPLWFDDYMRFWMVAMRIPVRARAILRGGAVTRPQTPQA